MKIVIYSNTAVVNKVQEALANEHAEIIALTPGRDNITTIEGQSDLTLAAVDIAAKDADAVYEYLKKSWDIPVIMVVDSKDDEWRKLQTMDADGYIRRNSGTSEITARLIAVQRRYKRALAGKTQ